MKKLPPASSAASTCTYSYTFDGDTGWFACGTTIVTIQYTYGNYQAFGIGADYAVWAAWGTGSGYLLHGWESMGGQASDTTCAWDDIYNNAVIQVWGPQAIDRWCRYRDASTGVWSSWFQCDNWYPTGTQWYSFQGNNC